MKAPVSQLDWSIITLYLIAVVGLGIAAGFLRRKGERGGEGGHYFLAGNVLTWPVIGLAMFAANISTVHLVSLADIIRFCDDLGTNGGPFMAPKTYRELFKPRHTLLCDYVHWHSRLKTFLHSCGSIRALLPDLIEAGYDVINPVPTTCKGMEAEGPKADFGNDICFWGGGCDTKRVLPQGTPAEVKAHLKRRLEIFMPGGGFVFNTVHNILPEVPPQNIVAMFEAVQEFNQ